MPEVKFVHSSNHIEHWNYVIKIATAFQPNVFLTGLHRLLLTNKWVSAFPITNNCQGQLQTP